MKYCPNCGSEIVTIAKFCSECGEKLDFVTPITPSYTSNVPVTDYGQISSTSQYPVHTRPRQTYPSMEELTDIRTSKGLQIFIKASLLFTLIPLALFVVSLFDPEGSFDLIITLIGLIELPIFTYGLYTFVNETPTKFKEEGSAIVKLLAVYCVLAAIYSLITYFFVTEIPADATLSEMQIIAGSVTLITLIGLIPETILLIGSIKFTDWFNEIIYRIGIHNSTSRFKWIGILKVISTGTLVLSLFLLSTMSVGPGVEGTLFLASILLLIGAIALLAEVIMQILAGYKIYSILKQAGMHII